MDFAKAFDTVPHQRLLYKLQWYGVQGNIYRWIQSFLCKRTQKVVQDGVSSSPVIGYFRSSTRIGIETNIVFDLY